ncbi:MAG: rhodanese-like domain-containing protein [Candidatus Methylopumilus sp.]|jgi:rhodanese-related sulfurtransferase
MAGYKVIEASELFEMLANQKVVLVDVRNDNEVATGVIPGAIHIPLALIPVKHDTLNKEETTVVYCHSGIRSAQAAAYMASKEHGQVFNLQGGVLAWGRAGYPFA